MTASELQNKKTQAEIKIMKILENLNKLCVENGFQVETITLNTSKTDEERVFDIDIHLV